LLDRLLFVPAVEIAPDEKIVRVLAHHAAAVTGQTPTTLGCGPWNDGWMFITRGIPAVCGFGPNGAGVHGPDEYVTLDSLIATARIYARAVIDF
jgi:acetylornithine deacetylase/succinyl-diaminopimelate desuccinylase-like protein